jgi:hypothetical protein
LPTAFWRQAKLGRCEVAQLLDEAGGEMGSADPTDGSNMQLA